MSTESGEVGERRMVVQRRLQVGSSKDPLEREADTVGLLISRAIAASPPFGALGAASNGRAQRAERPPGAAESTTSDGPARVHRASRSTPADGGTVAPDVESKIRRASGGASLAPTVRAGAERVLGADLGDVRLHGGSESTHLNDALDAEAFTHGSDIFFRSGLPDAGTQRGRELLGHELTHTVQQGGIAQRKVQRKKKAHTPSTKLKVIDDWVGYSGGSKPKRSPLLKAVDLAVQTWAGSGRNMGGAIDTNITQLDAITTAIKAWKAKKGTDLSVRDTAISDLDTFVSGQLATFQTRKLQSAANDAQAQGLHDQFAKIDDETGKFAAKNAVDIKPGRYLPGSQTPGLMAHTKKNADGSLTGGAMDDLDDLQIAERDGLIAKARGEKITVADGVSPEQLRTIMDSALNPLSGETLYPELATITDPSGPALGEITETKNIAGSKFSVTYDPSDPNGDVRLGALEAAVKLINRTVAKVPDLDVYFPKAGRSVEVDAACQVTVKKGIADAVFYAPAFFAVSSANVGNPKDDKSGNDFKFLSTGLSAADGFTTALRNSIIHELGHACHYANDRSRFYNLNFARFSGTATDGRTYQDIAESEVSGYGNNPREMVAEIFLAAVVGGKNFSPVVWEMYRAFGGAPLVTMASAL